VLSHNRAWEVQAQHSSIHSEALTNFWSFLQKLKSKSM